MIQYYPVFMHLERQRPGNRANERNIVENLFHCSRTFVHVACLERSIDGLRLAWSYDRDRKKNNTTFLFIFSFHSYFLSVFAIVGSMYRAPCNFRCAFTVFR